MTTSTEPQGDDFTLVSVTLTCETEGCGNAGVAIPLDVPDTVTAAVCGVCGNPIPLVPAEPEPEPTGG